MTDSRRERAELCDLLTRLGPDQPTLCQGWDTRQLAAHLWVRERRPVAAAGNGLRPLAGHTARVQDRVARRPYEQLVAQLRKPPWWVPFRVPAVDRLANTMEMFIHHEDVRRGQAQWQPRELSDHLQRALWTRARGLARLRLRKYPATLTVAAPGYGELSTGRRRTDDVPVRLAGAPGELLLFLTGRQRAAQVEVTGPAALTGRLTGGRLGI